MTEALRTQIVNLQYAGHGYKHIATVTGIPQSTIKRFCRDNPVSAKDIADRNGVCRHCGAKLVPTPHKKVKRYCSDKCRMAYWHQHPDELNRKAFYHLSCRHCGKPFVSYGNEHRKYCSRACYGATRRKEVCHG